MSERPWTANATGLAVAIRLTPKGGRDAIGGIEILPDGRSVLTARVRAAPIEGEANIALIRFLARSLDVPARAVTLTAGSASRVKRVVIEGDAAALAAKLEKLAGTS